MKSAIKTKCHFTLVAFSAPLTPEADAKLCIRRGYSQEDAGKPGWASIVISEKNL